MTTATRSDEIKLVSDLLTSPNRIDRVLRRSDDGTLYSTDAERYIGNDGVQTDGGTHVKVPAWYGYDPTEEDLETEAIALLDQLDAIDND